MSMDQRNGTTRTVVLHDSVAVKFATGDRGRRGNLREAELWDRYSDHPTRSQILCPVLWCAADGSVLIMPKTLPLSLDFDLSTLPDWDYQAGADDSEPFESKAPDWGILDGRVVAVDYAADAL
jgi:hypothetical protein